MSEKDGDVSHEPREIEDPAFRDHYDFIKADDSGTQTPSNYRDSFLRIEDWLEYEGLDSWEDISKRHISSFINWCRDERDLWEGTIERHTERLSAFFQYQRDEYDYEEADEIIDRIRNYSFDSQTLFAEKTGDDVLYVAEDEYPKIVRACETLREELIIRILWETGIRRSELAELTLQRTKTDQNIIKVNNKKNDKSRPIPYSDELVPVMREWLEYGGRSKYSTADDSSYLIVTQHSEQIQPKYVNDVVRRVADRTDVSYVYGQDAAGRDLHFPTAHHFRSAYATHRVANGMNLEKVKELMGHKDVAVTSRYVGVKKKQLREDNEKYRPKTMDISDEVARNL